MSSNLRNLSNLIREYKNIIVDNNVLYKFKYGDIDKKPYNNEILDGSFIKLSSNEINIDLELLSDLINKNKYVNVAYPHGHYSIYWKKDGEIFSTHSCLGWPLTEFQKNLSKEIDNDEENMFSIISLKLINDLY
jgi:hypothetical protein